MIGVKRIKRGSSMDWISVRGSRLGGQCADGIVCAEGAVTIGRVGMAERLTARRAEIEEAIFERINGVAFDAVRDADSEYMQGLRLTVGAVVNYSLLAIDRGGSEPGAVPRAAVVQARRAAREGVQLGTVLRRYVAGQALLEDFAIQEATDGDLLGGRVALRGVMETFSLLLDRLLPSIATAYNDELSQASRARWQRQPTEIAVVGASSVVAPRSGAPRSASQAPPAADQRRARILQALVEVVAERGYAGASVELVTERARVGRDTFHRLFGDIASCFEVVLDCGLQRALEMIGEAFERESSWLVGTRTALASLLTMLDSEPLLARVWLVESLAGGSRALERRERNLARLRERVLVLWPELEMQNPPPLAIEGLVGSVMGVVHTHLVTGDPDLMIELLGPLMGMIVRPYLGVERAEREIERAQQLVSELRADASMPTARAAAEAGGRSLCASLAEPRTGVVLPAMLSNPRAHRLRQCLLFVAAHPESSNREIAAGVGITHDSQVSKLLSDLLAEGLLVKRCDGVGKRNVWSVATQGEVVAQLLTS
jgi:AcrR family transcriptional regulator